MAWDGAHHNVVLVDNSGNTWLWDGSVWSMVHPSETPPGSGWASIAYDAGRGRVVLFGGSYSNGTWTWDGSAWTQQHPATSPPPIEEAPMVYDAALDRVVLIDGGLWAWDGHNWSTLPSPSGNIRVPANTGLAYDAGHRMLVCITEPRLDADPFDTWLFDGSTWKQVSIGSGPRFTSLPNFVYDSATQTAVLYGGAEQDINDTWSWNGTTWRQLYPPTAPPHLTGSGPDPAATYDADHRLFLLFGGYNYNTGYLNSLWAWDGNTWKQLQ